MLPVRRADVHRTASRAQERPDDTSAAQPIAYPAMTARQKAQTKDT